RDWLMPLGIDTNHGEAYTVVMNSEVAKKRGALQSFSRMCNGGRLEPVSVGTTRANCTGNAVNRRKNVRMRSIASSMTIKLVGSVYKSSFSCRGGSSGDEIESRSNFSD